MTQEDKDLLFRDLCARLPYGVKAKIKHYDNVWELLAIYTNGTIYATKDVGYPIETYSEYCKPYLFPLSSMTEEQEKEWKLRMCNFGVLYDTPESYDYLYENHIDVRGLIPRGLANDATGLNIY